LKTKSADEYVARPNIAYKSSSGDEIPERDVTYLLICLLIYH